MLSFAISKLALGDRDSAKWEPLRARGKVSGNVFATGSESRLHNSQCDI